MVRVAVFDLDGTITYKDTYVDFLLYCLRKNPARFPKCVVLPAYFVVYKLGLRSNHWLKARFLQTVASGFGGRQFTELCFGFWQRTIQDNIKPKALEELSRLREAGYTLVLATASFDFYVTALSAELSMDHVLCTIAERDSKGRITGRIDGKNCIGDEKAERLKTLCHEQGWVSVERVYSDDIVDRPIFELADVALVVDPKPETARHTAGLGYKILNWL